MEIRLESTAGLARQAEVWVDGTLLTVMDEYSRAGEKTPPGLLGDAKFVYMTEEAFAWDGAARGNRAARKLIDPVRAWRYVGYGQIVQVMPVLIDFGLLTMEDPNWSTDEHLVGRFVRVAIDRLSLTRAAPPDWPANAR
jgi:hypothetical protein